MLAGWLAQWNSMRPASMHMDQGLKALEQLLHEQIQLQVKQQNVTLPGDYEILLNKLRLIFRRYAFQPAAVCAYLAIVALDLHRIRSDLMQRLYFQAGEGFAEGLPE